MFKTFLDAPISIPAAGSVTYVAPMPPHVLETAVSIASSANLAVKIDWYDEGGQFQVALDTLHDGAVPSYASGVVKTKSPYAIIRITNNDGAAAASVDQVSLFY